jgi:hypothetical protein
MQGELKVLFAVLPFATKVGLVEWQEDDEHFRLVWVERSPRRFEKSLAKNGVLVLLVLANNLSIAALYATSPIIHKHHRHHD